MITDALILSILLVLYPTWQMLQAWHVIERETSGAAPIAKPAAPPSAPPAVNHGPQACTCALCTEARKVQHLMLTPIEMGQLQVGVINVRRGIAPVAVCESEFVLADGAGSTVLLITNDVVYQRIVRPALSKHFSTPGGA